MCKDWEEKKSIFADGMTFYVENSKESTKKSPEMLLTGNSIVT